MESLRKAPSLSCRYAIYSYNPQRCKEFQNGGNGQKNLDLDSDESAMAQNPSFGLSLVCGNLEPDLEVDLRPFVAKRIGRGLLGVGSTTVSPMDFKLPSETGRVVPLAHSFCTMLTPGEPPAESAPSETTEDELKVIICLLCSSSHLLRAYNLELLQFCRQMAVGIDAKRTEISKEAKSILSNWDSCTHYLSDCLLALGQDNTALLLQAILENHSLRISCEGEDADLEPKLNQLWEAFNISKIVGHKSPPAEKEGAETPSRIQKHDDGPTLIVKDGAAVFYGFNRAPSSFAAEWARVLHHHVNDYVKLKDHFDAYNGKIVQILNNLKRLIKAGEASYHALFRSSLFLRWTGAPITFLNHVRDQADTFDTETLDIIDVLREFLIEEGFQD